MQDGAQPCTSGYAKKGMPQINVAKAVQIINSLKAQNNKLTEQNDELREELARTTQKYNELYTREAVVANENQTEVVCAPTAQNETIQMLTSKLEVLKLELQEKQNRSPDEVLEQAEYQSVLEQYKKTIQAKDKQLSDLRKACGQPEMARKISKLENMLDKARGTIRVFAEQIETLRQETRNMITETHTDGEGVVPIQAVSADDDINGQNNQSPRQSTHNIEVVPRDDLEDVKELNLKLQANLNEAVTAKEKVTADLVTIRTENAQLHDENQQLLTENEALKQQTNNQPGDLYQTQMKAFMEDFSLERQEKQQLMELKENLRGENNSLKQQLSQLNNLLAEQRSSGHNPLFQTTAPPPPAVTQAVFDHNQVQPFHDRYSNPQTGLQMHVPSPQPPQVSRQQSNLVHSLPAVQENRQIVGPVESLPRRIGFPQANPQLDPSHVPPNTSHMPPNNSHMPPSNSHMPPNNTHMPPNNSYVAQASSPPHYQSEPYDYRGTPAQPHQRYPRANADSLDNMQPKILPNQSPPEKR